MIPIKKFKSDSYKKMLPVVAVLIIFFFTGCKSSNTISEPQNFEELKEIVNNRELTIKFQWAQPQRGGMIDLLSNPNEITMSGDRVAVSLPYFGVRHRGGGYGHRDGGINYEGRVSDLIITEDPAKRNIILKFNANEDSEILEFYITFFENGMAHASVLSSDRDNINYQRGVVQPTSRLTKK